MTSFDRPLHANHHCRHYEYVRAEKDWGPKCSAGIDLKDQPTAPCMPDAPESVAASAQCVWREEYTEEERAAWEAWRAQRAARMIVVLAEIPGSSRDHKNKPHWGEQGEFACPACDVGKVRWARARSNGHVHAGCSTPGCFSVIE